MTHHPELELLEYLQAQDEPLGIALLLFDADNNADNFRRACHSIATMIREEQIVLKERDGAECRVLEAWKVRVALADKSNWQHSAVSSFFLCLKT